MAMNKLFNKWIWINFQGSFNLTDIPQILFFMSRNGMEERKKNASSFQMAQSTLTHLSYANLWTAVIGFFLVCSQWNGAFFSWNGAEAEHIFAYLKQSNTFTRHTHTNMQTEIIRKWVMWIQAHTGQYLLAAQRNCKYVVETQKRKYQNHGLLPFLLRMQNRYISDEVAIYLPIERGWCGAKRA